MTTTEARMDSSTSAQSCKNQIEILLNLQPQFMRLSFYARLRILSSHGYYYIESLYSSTTLLEIRLL